MVVLSYWVQTDVIYVKLPFRCGDISFRAKQTEGFSFLSYASIVSTKVKVNVTHLTLRSEKKVSYTIYDDESEMRPFLLK